MASGGKGKGEGGGGGERRGRACTVETKDELTVYTVAMLLPVAALSLSLALYEPISLMA